MGSIQLRQGTILKYFYDTEFLEDGKTIQLISIGIVADDGREYYAHVDGYDEDAAWGHEFVGREVMPHLATVTKTPRNQVAQEISEFMLPDSRPDLWGFFSSYDHVLLAQLYGTMLDLPAHFPMRTNDIAQLAQHQNIYALPHNPNAHNALADAHWTRNTYHWLTT